MNRRLIPVFFTVFAAIFIGWQLSRPPANPTFDAEVIAPDGEIPNLGFQATLPDNADLNPQLDYQRERWQLDLSACYNNQPASITFERIGLIASNFAPDRESAWAFQHVMIAILDLPDQQQTRYSRMVLGLAGTESEHIWLENWSLRWDDSTITIQVGDSLQKTFTLQDDLKMRRDQTYLEIQAGLYDETCSAVLIHQIGSQLP